MKKFVVIVLAMILPFIYTSKAIAGTCPFGGSPNWQGVCDTTTDSGQSYFGPSLTQEEADAIGPAPSPPPPPSPTPDPTPDPSPTPTPTPSVSIETLLMLMLGLLSKINDSVTPTPSPSPTLNPSESPLPTPSESLDTNQGEGQESPSPTPSSESLQEETPVSDLRNIIIKPEIINDTLVLDKRLIGQKNKIIIIASKNGKKRFWSKTIVNNNINIKVPKKYLSWNISVRYTNL